MRRLRTRGERLFLAAFLLGSGLCLVLHLSQLVRHGFAWIPLTVAAAEAPDGLPTVRTFRTPSDEARSALEIGDALVSVGHADLRGVGPVGFVMKVYEQSAGADVVPVSLIRNGEERVEMMALLPVVQPWRVTVLAVAFLAMGILAYWRSGTNVARLFFVASGFFSLHWVYLFGGPGPLTVAGIVLLGLGPTIGVPVTIRWMLSFPEDTARHDRWSRTWPWLFAPIGVTTTSWAFGTPFDPALGQVLNMTLSAAAAATIITLLILNYRRTGSAGRRQIKWLVFGFQAALAPVLVLAMATLIVPPLWRLYELSLVFEAAIPIGAFIAIGYSHLFDIDRLLTRATSFTVLSLLFLAGPLFAAPQAAQAMAEYVDPGVNQLAIALVMSGMILSARNRLEPKLERFFFRERAALEERAQGLRSDLAGCEKTEELFQRLGDRLVKLLHPTSLAIYVDTGGGFAPAFAHGPAVAPAFASNGPLVTKLMGAEDPVRVEMLDGGKELGGFDAAAVASMAAELFLPIRDHGDLEGFVVLGSKESGDRYTGADAALLGSIADKAGDVIEGFARADVLRERETMVERLQRFVPGAIVEQVQQGEGFEPGEREVSVMFADIRGYTTFSESRRPEAIFSAINRYTDTVSQIIRQHGGAVVDFSGDGVMAAFGAHKPLESKESAAVEAARAITAAVRELPVEDPAGGETRLDVGVGVATGDVFVGTIQSAERAIWTVLGNATNLAARLESMTRTIHAAVVIDAATYAGARDVTGFDAKGPTDVKGRTEQIEVYALPLSG